MHPIYFACLFASSCLPFRASPRNRLKAYLVLLAPLWLLNTAPQVIPINVSLYAWGVNLVIQPPKLGVLQDLYSQLPPSEAGVTIAQGLIFLLHIFICFNAFIVLMLLYVCPGSPKSKGTYWATTTLIKLFLFNTYSDFLGCGGTSSP